MSTLKKRILSRSREQGHNSWTIARRSRRIPLLRTPRAGVLARPVRLRAAVEGRPRASALTPPPTAQGSNPGVPDDPSVSRATCSGNCALNQEYQPSSVLLDDRPRHLPRRIPTRIQQKERPAPCRVHRGMPPRRGLRTIDLENE